MDERLSELRPRGKRTKKPYSFRLDFDLMEKVCALAKKRKVTINSVVETTMKLGLEKLEKIR